MNPREEMLSLRGRLRSVGYALKGISIVLRTQHNAWLHAVATVAVGIAGALLHFSRDEWCWIVFAIVGVWTAEALNTAIELLVDLVSPSYHPIAGKAKDVAAGAVLIAALGAVAIGVLIIGPHLATAIREW
jgi:diacylglycerol kinase (ATP)